MAIEEHRYDYPSEPIGNGNIYHRCSSCGRSAPAINGLLSNHLLNCEWRIAEESKMQSSKLPKLSIKKVYVVQITFPDTKEVKDGWYFDTEEEAGKKIDKLVKVGLAKEE